MEAILGQISKYSQLHRHEGQSPRQAPGIQQPGITACGRFSAARGVNHPSIPRQQKLLLQCVNTRWNTSFSLFFFFFPEARYSRESFLTQLHESKHVGKSPVLKTEMLQPRGAAWLLCLCLLQNSKSSFFPALTER